MKRFIIFSALAVLMGAALMSCGQNLPDISGAWTNTVKYKTEIPTNPADPASPVVGAFYTVQESRYEFSDAAQKKYTATVRTQFDRIEFTGEKPAGIDFDAFPAMLNHTSVMEGAYTLKAGAIELAPYSITFDGDAETTMDFDEYLAQNPQAAAYQGIAPLTLGDDGTLTIANFAFTRAE